jgi:hypothetical protein
MCVVFKHIWEVKSHLPMGYEGMHGKALEIPRYL